MKENKQKNTIKLLVIAVVLTLVVIVGTTYAWLRLTQQSETINRIKAGNLELTLDETSSNGINLTNEVPRSYKQGMTTKEYTFTLTNKSSTSTYTLSLKDLTTYTNDEDQEVTIADEDRLADSKVRYILLKDGEEASPAKSKILTDRAIDTGTIAKDQTITYSLRIWIDSKAGDNNTEAEIMGKVFNTQLSLEATQTTTEVQTLSFTDDSWSTIAANVKAGKVSAYQVGDTKTVDMGSLGTHTVRVANTSSCTNGETSQTACGFVVEFADVVSTQKMNSTNTNVGGWPASAMRTYVNGTIYNALPSELQNVIATTTVVSGHGSTSGEANFTSSDKLYLLSTKEVWGKDGTSNTISTDTAEAETRQLDYYKNKGVTTSNYSGAIKQYNGSNYYWWLRSAKSNGTVYFFRVGSSGAWNDCIALLENGVAPAFRIA